MRYLWSTSMSARKNHRKNKPQCDRKYRPKHIHIPVMRGLREEFGIVLHSALTAAELGHFSKDQYDRIGQALNCVWGALELRPPKNLEAAKLVIEGAMRAMNDAGRRGDASGIWVLRELEQVAVLAGIHKAEECLPRMDVFSLFESIQQFKLMKIEEMQTYEITALSPMSKCLEKIRVQASNPMEAEQQKSDLVSQGYVTMQSRLILEGDSHANLN
jgi:hypothetical protein